MRFRLEYCTLHLRTVDDNLSRVGFITRHSRASQLSLIRASRARPTRHRLNPGTNQVASLHPSYFVSLKIIASFTRRRRRRRPALDSHSGCSRSLLNPVFPRRQKHPPSRNNSQPRAPRPPARYVTDVFDASSGSVAHPPSLRRSRVHSATVLHKHRPPGEGGSARGEVGVRVVAGTRAAKGTTRNASPRRDFSK